MGRVAALLTVSAAAFAQPASVPKFEDFPATETFSGKPVVPVLTTRGDRAYRTRIREGAARGPNFAGYLTIATWGCGTACEGLAVIDARSGEIYRGLPPYFGYGLSLKYADGADSYSDKFEPLSFKLTSRLLLIHGCPEDKDCALYAYEWTGKTFRLLSRQPAKPSR